MLIGRDYFRRTERFPGSIYYSLHAANFPKKSITMEYVGHDGFNRNADGIKSKQLHVCLVCIHGGNQATSCANKWKGVWSDDG